MTVGFGVGMAALAAALLVAARPQPRQEPVADDGAARDLRTVRERLAQWLLPREADEAHRLTAAAQRTMEAMADDGSWPDVDYADDARSNWKAAEHLARAGVMARALRAPDQPLEGDPVLRERIGRAVAFWLARDPRNPNWWHNEIGTPQALGEILLLLDGPLPPEQAARAGEILRRGAWKRWTGQNLVWGAVNQVMRGCIEGDAAAVREAFDGIYREMRVASPGQEGVQADWSFHQHGSLLYSGGYGLGFAIDCARCVAYAHGTRFACPPAPLSVLSRYLLDGEQWMIRGRVFDYGAIGRQITRPGEDAASLVLALDALAGLPGPDRARYAAFARRLRGERGARPLVGNRHFWKSDFMVHHRPGFYASARMFSRRTLNTDGYINGENRRSHHLADGCMYLMRTGEEYRDIFPAWDWRRVPGTTCEQDPAPLVPARVQVRGAEEWAGGVSDGRSGLASMHLERGGLRARKAWAFFDDCVLCLGAGIACGTPNPVLTSVEQCLARGEVSTSGQTVPLIAGRRALGGPAWAWHDGVGYRFQGPGQVTVAREVQAGDWTEIGVAAGGRQEREVFSAWVDHGGRPSGQASTYAYLVLPRTTAAALARMRGLGPVRVLANTPKVQAAMHVRSGVVVAAFHEPGGLEAEGLGAVTVDVPCLLLARPGRGRLTLAVASAEARPAIVTVSVVGGWQGEGCVAGPDGVTRVRAELPGGQEAGSSVRRLLVRPGGAAPEL